MRVIVLADTHVPDGSGRTLDPQLLDALRDADVVLHAGDVLGEELLDELRTVAPVHAVLGNNDRALVGCLPEELVVDLDGVTVAMVHDAGARVGRAERLARRYPDADLVVFGHSHQPEDDVAGSGLRIFNPGSPTQRRRAPTRTYGVLEVEDGAIVALRHVHLD
jgi:putative phosphoesterase